MHVGSYDFLCVYKIFAPRNRMQGCWLCFAGKDNKLINRAFMDLFTNLWFSRNTKFLICNFAPFVIAVVDVLSFNLNACYLLWFAIEMTPLHLSLLL